MATTVTIVCPGDRLRFAEEFAAGPGTYVRDQHVVAAVVGESRVVAAAEGAPDARPVVEVVRRGGDGGGGGGGEQVGGTLIPQVGDVVFAKITRINPRLCNAEIVCVNGKAVEDKFAGVIRTQDVRATEVDKVDIYDCFLPSDVVRAKVISLGDTRSYYLSTAENELGVVQAKSPFTGEAMVPVSWQEMSRGGWRISPPNPRLSIRPSLAAAPLVRERSPTPLSFLSVSKHTLSNVLPLVSNDPARRVPQHATTAETQGGESRVRRRRWGGGRGRGVTGGGSGGGRWGRGRGVGHAHLSI
jgi:exosome complex component CSL4